MKPDKFRIFGVGCQENTAIVSIELESGERMDVAVDIVVSREDRENDTPLYQPELDFDFEIYDPRAEPLAVKPEAGSEN